MKHPLYNLRGQHVGDVDDQTDTYYSQRDLSKGQIFIKKNWFGGKYIERPIAIDEEILDKLLKNKIKYSEIMIVGLEKNSFIVKFENEIIKVDGVLIQYDKRNVRGQNVTGFGLQRVFSIMWGQRKEIKNGRVIEQKKLEM